MRTRCEPLDADLDIEIIEVGMVDHGQCSWQVHVFPNLAMSDADVHTEHG